MVKADCQEQAIGKFNVTVDQVLGVLVLKVRVDCGVQFLEAQLPFDEALEHRFGGCGRLHAIQPGEHLRPLRLEPLDLRPVVEVQVQMLNLPARVGHDSIIPSTIPRSTSWNQANGSTPHRLQEATKLRSTAAVLPPLSLPKNVQLPRPLAKVGLHTKAVRQARCGVFGSRLDCSNTECGRRYYRSFRCKNRYCLKCGRRIYNELFRRYLGLAPAVDALLRIRGRLIAKLDFTTVNLGRMPTRDEVREFNACIKRFCRALERALRISGRDYGLVYCDEFGGGGTNLHAHGVYVGPVIPRQWFGQGNKLSEMWKNACRGTVFEGSFIVSAKSTDCFGRGLGHALKYAGKFVDKDPVRLAALELAFHGVRRIHALGAFYNALSNDEGHEAGDTGGSCPQCGSALLLLDIGIWHPICNLRREGRRDLDEAWRDAKVKKAFERTRDG